MLGTVDPMHQDQLGDLAVTSKEHGYHEKFTNEESFKFQVHTRTGRFFGLEGFLKNLQQISAIKLCSPNIVRG